MRKSIAVLLFAISSLPQWGWCDSPELGTTESILSMTSLSQVSKGEPCVTDPACCTDCCVPCWKVYGEFLYIRPGNDKVAYAVPINGAIVPPSGAPPVQVGMEAVADVSFSPGYRIGGSCLLDECASVGLMYTGFDSSTHGSVDIANTPYVLRSLVDHPGTVSAPTNFLDAAARLSVDFKLADIEYRRLLAHGECYSLNYLLGLRYGNLHQSFASTFANSTTRETVDTRNDFDGLGLRFGLEGERYAPCCGWMVYSKGYASFLGGVSTNRYTQADNFRGTVVNTGWNEDRVVSMLDAEIGIGWTNCNGRVRFTTGYMVSAWMNTINSDDFIRSIQRNSSSNSPNLASVMTFDGVTTRLEFRF
jgi:hypothetical protein